MKSRTSGSRLLARSVAALLLLSGVIVGSVSPAAAQNDDSPGLVSDTEYESPQFDFTLTWDDPWELSEGTVASEEGTLDQISLESPGAFLQIIMIVPNDEPQAYLDVLLDNIKESGTDYEEIGNDSGDDYLSATVDFTAEFEGGPVDLREYVEVGTLETTDGDEALFTASLLATPDTFADEWEGLQDSVERDGGDPLFLGTPEGIKGGSSTTEPTPKSNSTSEGGIDGDTFVGPTYGFSVEWDSDLWEAEDDSDSDGDALVLTSEASQVQFRSYNEQNGTARTCVTETADAFESGDNVTEFGRTSDYDPPEAGEDGYARLYAFNYESSSNNSVPFIQYIECRPMGDEEGVYLLISFLTPEESYEDELPAYTDVVDTVEFGNGGGTDLSTNLGRQGSTDENGTSTHTKEPVLKSASFTGGAFNYQAVWDKDVWTAEAIQPDDGYEGVSLTSDGSSAWVEALESFNGDPETCVTETGDQLNTFDNVSDVAEVRRPTLPDTVPDASVALYSYTYTPDNGDPLDFVEYIECRELVPDTAVLRITIIAVLDSYEDLIPEWEDMIAGVKINGTQAKSNDADKTPTSDETDENTSTNTSGDQPGVEGRTYTSPPFGFKLSWDNSWDVVSATDEDGLTTLTLSNGVSTAIVFGGTFPVNPADCVAAVAEVAGGAAGVSNFKAVTDDNGEEQAGGDSTYGFGLFSLTRGGDDYFDYIYCQPASNGDYVVAVVYQMPISELATELTTLQTLLSTLEVD